MAGILAGAIAECVRRTPSRTAFVHRIENAASRMPALLASRALFCAVGVRVVNRRIGVSSAGARCLCLDPCELRVLLQLPTLQYASALSVWLLDHGMTSVVSAVSRMPRLQWLAVGSDEVSVRSAIDAGLRAICSACSGLALRTLELLPPPEPETARMLATACNGALETYRCAYGVHVPGDSTLGAWSNDHARAFLARCPRMRDLALPGAWQCFMSAAEIEGAARLCPRLRRLRLERAAMSSAEAAQLLSLLPALEELEVFGDFEPSVFRAASRCVRKVSLFHAGNGALASLAEHCASVTSLRIGEAPCPILEDTLRSAVLPVGPAALACLRRLAPQVSR